LSVKGISYFHATDCFAGANEFEGIHSPEREAVLDRILALVLEHRLRLIGHDVDEDTYKPFAPRKLRNDFGVNRYVAALEGAVSLHVNLPTPTWYTQKTLKRFVIFTLKVEFTN
jgi:hypothetical protein